jgi:hypothetical protein
MDEILDEHEAKQFAIRGGFCRITPEALELIAAESHPLSFKIGGRTVRYLDLMSLVVLTFISYIAFHSHSLFLGAVVGCLLLIRIVVIANGLMVKPGNASLPKAGIRQITHKAGKPPFTPGEFIISYNDESNSQATLSFFMAGKITGDKLTTEKAIAIFKSEGLMAS